MSSLQTQYVLRLQNPIRGFLKEFEEKFRVSAVAQTEGADSTDDHYLPLLMSCCMVVPLQKKKKNTSRTWFVKYLKTFTTFRNNWRTVFESAVSMNSEANTQIKILSEKLDRIHLGKNSSLLIVGSNFLFHKSSREKTSSCRSLILCCGKSNKKKRKKKKKNGSIHGNIEFPGQTTEPSAGAQKMEADSSHSAPPTCKLTTSVFIY